MKKILITILMVMCAAVGSRAQIVFGNEGLINIPTADMKPEGTFVGGATFLPNSYLDVNHHYNTGMYYFTLTPLPFVEMTFRETLARTRKHYLDDLGNDHMGEWGYFQQDRSYTLRVRPLFWVKNKWIPQLVIGTNDPWSDNGGSYYSCVYGVVTEHINFKKVGDFSISAGYSRPMHENDGFGARKAYDGAFCGVGYTPAFWDKMMLSVDYDTQGVNFGANVILFNHWNIYAYERDFKKFGFGMSYQYTIDF